MVKPGPDRHDIQQALSWNRRLNRLAYHIGDLFPQLIRWLPKRARDHQGDTVLFQQ